jgi:alpha-L-rhamnosidase
MKKITLILVALLIVLGSRISVRAQEWNAQWISKMESQSATNTWLAFRKNVQINDLPDKAIAKIAVDSKYWLWINGKLVIFEGGLKRGPNPLDTYYDAIDIAPHLKKGSNTIAVLVWYFGKDGFTHKSSGKAALIFDCDAGAVKIRSDRTWKSTVLSAYQTAEAPIPNFRLPESSILFDARKDIGNWQNEDFDDKTMGGSMELGAAGDYPWNKLVQRSIPFWKDYGLKNYTNKLTFPFISTGDTIVCDLPYNAQITPYFEIESEENEKIKMCTDNYLYYNAGDTGIRAEYITKKGIQKYESLGWINGHKVYYFIPKGVKVIDLKYRETGYNTEFVGNFTSSDPFLNKLWQKAVRSVYVNMRDTYMDCPERERAQWSGDQVHESAQAYYMFSSSSHALARKYLYETIAWQKKNASLFGPVPAGNWDKELPEHIMTSIGHYGVGNYYLNTGDKTTLSDTYEGIKKYLALWEPDGKGTMKLRKGDWTWGDWGKEKDIRLIYNLWYYLAIKSTYQTAMLIGKTDDANRYRSFMESFKNSFNQQFWTGKAYRSPENEGRTDDRVQALAILSDIASAEKYPLLLEVFKQEEHCSPFMEKFVLEAMLKMGYVDEGIARYKKRFSPMVNDTRFTTLWEGWGIGKAGFGGGSINHGWGGAGIVVMFQYLCGLTIDLPGYKSFKILPMPGTVKEAAIKVPTVFGNILTQFINLDKRFDLNIEIPKETTAIVGIPNKGYKEIFLNNKLVWKNGKYIKNPVTSFIEDGNTKHIKFNMQPGAWNFKATK